MKPLFPSSDFQEFRIEDEPILGTVLRLPDGRIQTLTWWERVRVALRHSASRPETHSGARRVRPA